jgi:hypothetical protein
MHAGRSHLLHLRSCRAGLLHTPLRAKPDLYRPNHRQAGMAPAPPPKVRHPRQPRFVLAPHDIHRRGRPCVFDGWHRALRSLVAACRGVQHHGGTLHRVSGESQRRSLRAVGLMACRNPVPVRGAYHPQARARRRARSKEASIERTRCGLSDSVRYESALRIHDGCRIGQQARHALRSGQTTDISAYTRASVIFVP